MGHWTSTGIEPKDYDESNNIHSFIHSDHFYSASSSPLLLRSASDTTGILCRSFTPKRHKYCSKFSKPFVFKTVVCGQRDIFQRYRSMAKVRRSVLKLYIIDTVYV